jgi:hypothetical protein
MILGLAALALVSLTGVEASACHKAKKCATPCAAPAPVCEPVPVATCAPAPKKHCFKMPKFKMPKIGCHKKAACETVVAAPTCNTCEVAYAAPQASYAAPQSVAPAAQSLPVPQK